MSDGVQVDGPVGVGILLAAYRDESAAKEKLGFARSARADGLIEFEDAAVVRRDLGGHVHISESGDMSTGKGAGIGALIGGLIGVLGGPAGIAIGAGAGAAIGGVSAHADAGFDNESLSTLGAALPEGSSALVLTTSIAFVESVRSGSTPEETLTTAQEISSVVSEHLGAGDDVLMTVAFTEVGVAAAKVVSGSDHIAALGISATEDAVDVIGIAADADGAISTEAIAVVERIDDDGPVEA